MTDTKELVEHLRYRAKYQTANDPLKMLIAAADAIERLERERDELRREVMGGEPDYANFPSLSHGNFIEMARSLHAACHGGRTRAVSAESELTTLRARVEMLRDLADTAFVTINWSRRMGFKRDRQIAEVVKAFEITLGYREPAEPAPLPASAG